MEPTRDEDLALLDELERASDRGLMWECKDYEAFAAAVLAAIGQPDTPVNRAKLQVGEPGALTSLMAGPEMSYYFAFIPASPKRPAGQHFMIEREESNSRIWVLVVSPEVAHQFE